MKLLRVAAVASVVLLVVAAASVVALAAVGDRLLATAIERAGPALVGRQVQVGGVSIGWGRRTVITATDLVVADAAWSDASPMLRVRRAELTIDLLDLPRFRVAPVRLALRQPTLRLARNAQGQWNLPRTTNGGGASGVVSPLSFAPPREVEIEGGEVTVDDLATPGLEGRIADLAVNTPDAADEVHVGGTASLHGGAPIAFSGRTGPLAELLRGDDGSGAGPFPVRLEIGPETARLSAVGHLARPLDLAGVDLRVEGRGDDLAPLLAAFAVPVAATPPFRLSARLTDSGRGWTLQDIMVGLGESRVGGTAAVSSGGRGRPPRLSADLAAPRVVLSDFGWLLPAGAGSAARPGTFAEARLPAAWLRRAEADGDLRVERLEGLVAEPAGLRLGFELEDGRLRVEPFRLELAGGVVEGSATVDATDGTAPRLALVAEAGGLRLEPLLAPFGVWQVTGTLASASVDLRGQGATPREVAAGLDGAVRLRFGPGSIDVPDLARLSMNLLEAVGEVLGFGASATAAPAATPVTCAAGDFPVRDGVARAERLIVLTPRVAIEGEGAVHLGPATMRLVFTPHPLDEGLLRVVVPVVISGPLASPEVTVHPELGAAAWPEADAGLCGEKAGR